MIKLSKSNINKIRKFNFISCERKLETENKNILEEACGINKKISAYFI